jgi:NADP-dependent 3-hydroxy acid dehydrogenase YdfG
MRLRAGVTQVDLLINNAGLALGTAAVQDNCMQVSGVCVC